MTDNALKEPKERLCKDCWWFYPEKEICCEPEISETSLITGAKISLAKDLRVKRDLPINCGYSGIPSAKCLNGARFFPKEFSPTKITIIKKYCPWCDRPTDYNIITNKNGMRNCPKCNEIIYLW